MGYDNRVYVEGARDQMYVEDGRRVVADGRYGVSEGSRYVSDANRYVNDGSRYISDGGRIIRGENISRAVRDAREDRGVIVV
eukprot:NODE_11346_length_308_cov_20.957529_g10433_i0.p2 GENE.NODE_11346_length_308_cov_20.957529_g10433_i0~~NODE_11346_length_308_cov_20.957529_g10433_i0.p2  ORF type:complete len:90 (+),score=21.10 NODE_11346_length_308_cov_20.957529_g10433_i0:27-272(+)